MRHVHTFRIIGNEAVLTVKVAGLNQSNVDHVVKVRGSDAHWIRSIP
ncbi:Hypothetical protein (plasmid) [Pseudomonas putida]|nr:Hypothetical protein [Pseudomonas putida]